MVSVEKAARKQRQWNYVQQAALTSLLIGGLMLVGAVPVGLSRSRTYRRRYQMKTVLGRLAQKGYVTFVERDGRRYARLTDAGKQTLAMYEQKMELQSKSRKRWDKRWRVIIFDIPERRRSTRDKLRRTMQDAGFYRLQNSVWVYPRDCEDFLALLKADLKIGIAVLYMVVEKVENDGKLKEFFRLQ